MQITVESNIKAIMPKLEQFTSRQAPFTIAKALTNTAKLVQAEIKQQLPAAFDRPNAFTRQAFAVQMARKDSLTAIVFAKDRQARYLKFGVQGGGRRIKAFEKRIDATTNADTDAGTGKLVPTRNIRLDASGGVSLATIRRITQQGNRKYFIGKPQGEGMNTSRGYGIYERMAGGKRIKALMVFAEPQSYRKRLDMPGIGARVVRQRFDTELRNAWALAMRTAR
jgi:hypothetical protein